MAESTKPVVGILTRMGIGLEAQITSSLWPSASAAVVETILPYVSESLTESQQSAAIHTPLSGPLNDTEKVVSKMVQGQHTVALTYNGLELVHLLCWGISPPRDGLGVTLPQDVGAATAWRHVFEMSRSLRAEPWTMGDGFLMDSRLTMGQRQMRRMTLAQERGTAVWERKSVLCDGWELSASPAGVRLSMSHLCHSAAHSGTVNTYAILHHMSLPAWRRARFRQLRLRVAPHSASVPLDADDEWEVSSVTLRMSREGGRLQTALSGLSLDEPQYQGPGQFTGQIGFSRTPGASWDTWAAAKTNLMMEVSLLGPLVEGTSQNYRMTYYLPRVVLGDPQTGVSGPERQRPTYPFVVSQSATLAAGMLPSVRGLGEPVLEVVSTRAGHAHIHT